MTTLGQELLRIQREMAEEAEIKAYFREKELEKQRKRQAIAEQDLVPYFADSEIYKEGNWADHDSCYS